jgi:hypothetical protein
VARSLLDELVEQQQRVVEPDAGEIERHLPR